MTSSVEIPHALLKYRSLIIDIVDSVEDVDLVIKDVVNKYQENYDKKEQIANRMEKSAIRKIDKRLKFLIEKFRDLLVLKKAVREVRNRFKGNEKYEKITVFLERAINRDIRNLAKRMAEEKMKILAIKEYGLMRHENVLIYTVPIFLLLVMGYVKR